jgi:hypothetical protein
MTEHEGRQALWLWFELSYASFAVLPRVFMHEMPDEWQAKMAALLEEWDATWDWSRQQHFNGVSVRLTYDKKLVRTPEWIMNYRHPDRARIAQLSAARGEAAQVNTEGISPPAKQ